MGSCGSDQKITLTSSDGTKFVIEEATALLSQTIKNFIEDNSADNIPVPNVTGPTLKRVIEYLERHASAAAPVDVDDLKSFDANFVKADQPTLFQLVMAANYLDIKDLLNITAQAIADKIKDMSIEDVRVMFNVANDFSPEEEAEIRKNNPWAFE